RALRRFAALLKLLRLPQLRSLGYRLRTGADVHRARLVAAGARRGARRLWSHRDQSLRRSIRGCGASLGAACLEHTCRAPPRLSLAAADELSRCEAPAAAASPRNLADLGIHRRGGVRSGAGAHASALARRGEGLDRGLRARLVAGQTPGTIGFRLAQILSLHG